MSTMWNYLFVLLWMTYMLSTGIHLFSRGFLLSRETLPERSRCERTLAYCADVDNASCLAPGHVARTLNAHTSAVGAEILGTTCLPAKSKVILLVVDALKYDFGVYDATRQDPQPSENKLPVLHELLQRHPRRTRMLRFRADPPTTTLQRIKGLTTGSLPTFIDIGSNFATDEINEDNLLDQLVATGRRAVFMGDSTWTDLYPNRFVRAHPMASFNIYDLDSVDQHIERLLPAEQRSGDWQLLVAHALGVDHCGHKHGPAHPEMARKLGDADRMIRGIVERMDDDTTLLVIGDHGMTATGDHGGDTDDELDALLFAYTRAGRVGFHVDATAASVDSMQQIDLVPTLAAVLGVPVPYSSLGQINYNLLPDTVPADAGLPQRHEFLVHSLQNVHQMRRYQLAMAERSDAVLGEAGELAQRHEDVISVLLAGNMHFHDPRPVFVDEVAALRKFHAHLVRPYLQQMQRDFAAVWVKFDASQMSQGLLFVSLAALLAFMLINNLPLPCYERVFSGSRCVVVMVCNVILAGLGAVCYADCGLAGWQQGVMVMTGVGNVILLAGGLVFDFELIARALHLRSTQRSLFDGRIWLGRSVLLLTAVAVPFSNSFVVNEQYVLGSALMLLLVVLLYSVQRTNMQFDARRRLTLAAVYQSQYVWLMVLTLTGAILVRWSFVLFRCREEQQPCDGLGELNEYALDEEELAAALLARQQQQQQLLMRAQSGDMLPVLVFAVFVGLLQRAVAKMGTLRGNRPAVCMARYGAAMLGVCVAVHFVLARSLRGGATGSIGSSVGVSALHVDAVAWLAYAVCAAHAAVLVAGPLLVYVHGSAGTGSIQGIFRQIRDEWSGDRSRNMFIQIPLTEGLLSPYTAVFVLCGLSGGALVALVLGVPEAGGVPVTLGIAAVVLVLGSVYRFQTARSIEKCLQPNVTTVLTWFLLAHYGFYATGHQPTLSQIDWHAAFVGRQSLGADAGSGTLTAVALVLLNTFGMTALVFVLFPLLSVFGFTLYAQCPWLVPKPPLTPKGRFLVKSNTIRHELTNGRNGCSKAAPGASSATASTPAATVTTATATKTTAPATTKLTAPAMTKLTAPAMTKLTAPATTKTAVTPKPTATTKAPATATTKVPASATATTPAAATPTIAAAAAAAEAAAATATLNAAMASAGPNHVLERQHAFELERGELSVYETEGALMATVFRTGAQLMLLQALRVFASMMACTVHCRHLMVWKIFAPRFIYEGLASYAIFAAIVLGYALVMRCHAAIDGLLRSIALDPLVFDRLEKARRDETLRSTGYRPEQERVDEVNRALHERLDRHLARLERLKRMPSMDKVQSN